MPKFDPTKQQPPDKHGIIAHTPDPTKYFAPDGETIRHMRNGIRAVMIPRATRHGGSQGFESGPGTITVDPSKPLTGDGGISVDLSLITPETSKLAYQRACELTHDPEEQIIRAYQLMGMAVESAIDMDTEDPNWDEEEEERVNPVMPGAYVVPKSTVSGAQLENKPKRKKPKVVKPRAVKQKQTKLQTEQVPTDNPVLDLLVTMKKELDELKAEKRGAIKAFSKKRKKLPPVPKKPSIPNYGEDWEEESVPPKQLISESKAAQGNNTVYTPEQVMQALKSGYDKLGIPNLGPEPKKPGFRVEFDLGAAGRQEAWYHWVGEHNGCLFLIYDTRFEYGLRYSPPFLGFDQPITVRLPDHGGKEYRVYSIDLTHPFGIFAITNLILDIEAPRVGSLEHAIKPILNKLITDDEDAGDW